MTRPVAYMYQAALLCEACANDKKIACLSEEKGYSERHWDKDDPNYWPVGPFENGGGEADTPQHCDHCKDFLRNPLTPDGIAYVKTQIAEHYENKHGNAKVISEWAEFYGLSLDPAENEPKGPFLIQRMELDPMENNSERACYWVNLAIANSKSDIPTHMFTDVYQITDCWALAYANHGCPVNKYRITPIDWISTGVITLTASEFAELEACMTNPRAPTESILQGAALLSELRAKRR